MRRTRIDEPHRRENCLPSALLVFVVIATTRKKFTTIQGGLVAGLALTLTHLATIPVETRP
jgi:hypothetical protein